MFICVANTAEVLSQSVSDQLHRQDGLMTLLYMELFYHYLSYLELKAKRIGEQTK